MEVLDVMQEFQEAANVQITTKRNELLSPIIDQEREILSSIDSSYQNVIYANSVLTAYLNSIHKVKESQSEALETIGLKGIDTSITKTLIELSKLVDTAIEKADKIDVKSDEAYQQIEDIVNKIKQLTNQKEE